MGRAELAACAEFIWAATLAVESAHPVEAEYHVREAERLLSGQAPNTRRVSLAQIKFQLAGIVGQQGRTAVPTIVRGARPEWSRGASGGLWRRCPVVGVAQFQEQP